MVSLPGLRLAPIIYLNLIKSQERTYCDLMVEMNTKMFLIISGKSALGPFFFRKFLIKGTKEFNKTLLLYNISPKQ